MPGYGTQQHMEDIMTCICHSTDIKLFERAGRTRNVSAGHIRIYEINGMIELLTLMPEYKALIEQLEVHKSGISSAEEDKLPR